MEETLPTIGAALRIGSGRLRLLKLPDADLEAALLLGQVMDLDRMTLLTRTATSLQLEQCRAYGDLLAMRESRVPLQYLTGKQEFMSLHFEVNASVFIPRPETEHVVEAVLDLEEDTGVPAEGEEGRLVLDVGTGSGSIAVSLASYVKTLRVMATDISGTALVTAKANAKRHSVADRVSFRQADLLAELGDLGGRVNYLVSNPPYVASEEIARLEPEVRDWEPHESLDGGADGLEILGKLIVQGPKVLAKGGYLVLEVGAGQAPTVQAMLKESAIWTEIRTIPDYLKHERVVLARFTNGH